MHPRRPARFIAFFRAALAVFLLTWSTARVAAQTVFNWNSGDIVTGSITPTGTTTVGAADTLNILTGGDHDFNGLLVTNSGTVSWQAGNLRSGSGGIFTNNAAFNDTADTYQISNAFGGAGGTTFLNAATGVYTKSAGLTVFNIGFTNAGTVNVTGGTLVLANGGDFSNGSVAGSSGAGVFRMSGGTLNLTGNVKLTNFIFDGGTMAGNGTLVNSTVSWTAGNMNSGGSTTTFASGSTVSVDSGNNHDFQAHTIINNGTVNWTAGYLRSGSGGTLTNNGTWNDTANGYTFNNAYGGAGGTQFINAAGGTYLKTTGSTTISDGTFVNSGTVSVTGGTLNLDGGTFNGGSSIGSSGSGVVQLGSGALVANGTITVQNFLLSGGQLQGTQTFNGTLSWLAGDMNNAGSTTIGSGGTLTIATGNNHDFQAHALTNNGTVNWQAGAVRSGSGGILTNNGTWNDTADGFSINNGYGGAGGTQFVNGATGTYFKTAGATTFSDGTLVNNGTVSVTGGTLSLDGGTLNNGSTIGSTGAGVVQLVSGILTATGTVNTQNFQMNGGQLAGIQTFNGTLTWSNGNMNNADSTTIGTGSTLTIATGNNHDFQAHKITNNGTVNWLAGYVRSGSGGILTNNGTWNDSANGFTINNDYGGAGGTQFVNAVGGTYVKTSGTSTFNAGTLVNNGTISVTGGTLSLDGGTLNDGSTIGSSGSGVVQLVSGALTANGTVNTQNFQLNGGQLQGTQTFSGTLSWLGGDMNNSGSTTIGPAGTLTIATGNNHDFQSHTITNNGIVNWQAGAVRSGSGGIITNNGTWNDSSGGFSINNDFGGAGGTQFVNAAGSSYVKTGGSTTMLASFTNAGTITINSGSIAFQGSLTNTGTISIGTETALTSPNALTFAAGSMLQGGGALSAPSLAMAGKIDPGFGTSVSQLSLNTDVALAGTAVLYFDLGGLESIDYLQVNGAFNLGGTLAIRFLNNLDQTLSNSMTFTVASGTTLSGSFLNAANGARVVTADNLGSFIVNYGASSQFGTNNVVLSNFISIPEPSTWALLVAGSGMVAVVGRFRRRRG